MRHQAGRNPIWESTAQLSQSWRSYAGWRLLDRHTGSGAGKRFNAFFDYLGTYYKKFGKTCDVYSIFRCGLAHEYVVKEECTIIMLSGSQPINVPGTGTGIGPSLFIPDASVNPPFQGIEQASNGRYYFLVEQYYSDFRNACERLVAELEKDPGGGLPSFSGITWRLVKN